MWHKPGIAAPGGAQPMSIRIPVVMFVASLSIACASRNGDTAAGGSTTPPPPAGQTAGAGGAGRQGGAAPGSAAGGATASTAGAQAAARITPEQLDAAMKSISQTNA